MSTITITRGLDIPIAGAPSGSVRPHPRPIRAGVNFDPFNDLNLRLLVNQGDTVALGQPLAEDKKTPGRFITSPAGGTVSEIRRAEKRRLDTIVIDVASEEPRITHQPLDVAHAAPEALIALLMQAGLFAHIRARPFGMLADPQRPPRSIFVKAVESAPFTPSAELQVAGQEEAFGVGLEALRRLTQGAVHLVCREGSPFATARGVTCHTVRGPHPAGNASVHIHAIDPIRHQTDVVWVVDVLTVVAIGLLCSQGRVEADRVVALAGEGFTETHRGYYRVRTGTMIEELVQGRTQPGAVRLVSGDPLMGTTVGGSDVLGVDHTVMTALPDALRRQWLSFFRWGANKFTASGAYASGHMNWARRKWSFTTSQHGEERAFIDGSIYERVIPMEVLPMQLVRALHSDDYDRAIQYGLLEVHEEDFALPEFVCPCKIPMVEAVRAGLRQCYLDTYG